MSFFLYIIESGEVVGISTTTYAPLPVGKAEIEQADPVALSPWIYDGAIIRQATQLELDGFATAQVNLTLLEAQVNADTLLATTDSDIGQVVRALALVVRDEINILRAQHGLADRTKAQLLTAISNKISAGDAG